MITDTEIDIFVRTTHELLAKIRQDLLETQVGLLIGKTVKIERTLKDPATGDKVRHELDATITGAQWTYEDGIDFTVSYIHPYTEKVTETTEGA